MVLTHNCIKEGMGTTSQTNRFRLNTVSEIGAMFGGPYAEIQPIGPQEVVTGCEMVVQPCAEQTVSIMAFVDDPYPQGICG